MISLSIPIDTRPNIFSVSFTAQFNTPTVGEYDFSADSNQNLSMGQACKGALYLVETINIGGSIPEEDYLRAVKSGNIPQILFSWKSSKYPVFPKPIQLVNYIRNKQWVAWLFAKQNEDEIQASMIGSLNQIDSLVGVDSVRLSVSMDVYEITDPKYIEMFETGSDAFFRGSK